MINLILRILNYLLQRLAKKKIVLTEGGITSRELEDLLRSLFPKATVFLSDNRYRLVSRESMEKFLTEDVTNLVPYTEEDYDCDDFSFRLMGQFSVPGWSDIVFGIVWTDLHALNFIVDENKMFWFVEPQQDKVAPSLEAWQGSEVRLIVV